MEEQRIKNDVSNDSSINSGNINSGNIIGNIDLSPINITYEDFEFIEVIVNGQDIPPGSVFEVVLPNLRSNCFIMRGVFHEKETVIWASGQIKITAVPRSELEVETKP